MALCALVKPLTYIGGHCLNLGKTTLRTSQCGLQCDGFQFTDPTKLDGYPAFIVDSVKAETLILASSYVTTACRCLKFTSAWLTPGTCVKAFFTVIGQTGQSIVGMAKVTVLGAAWAASDAPAEETHTLVANNRFLNRDGTMMCIDMSFQ